MTLIAVLATGTASAQSMKNSGYYGEIGYLNLKIKDSVSTIAPKLARFVVGKELNENLSVEGVAAVTVSKDSWSGSGFSGTLSGKTYGVYAKPKVEITQGTEVFGRAGIAHTSWKDDTSVGSFSDSTTKVAYGLGIQTQFTKDLYGQVDYMNYGKKEAWKANGFTVSIGARF